MIIRRKFILPLYNIPYEIFVVDTLEEARRIYPEFSGNAAATAICNDDYSNTRIIFLYNEATDGIVAHECVHLAGYICRKIGIKVDPKNDEPFAYIVQHADESAIKTIKAHKPKEKENKD